MTDKKIIYELEVTPFKDQFLEDCPAKYRVLDCPEATGGIMIEGYYPSRKKWIANPQTRHLIKHFLSELSQI